MTQHRDDDDTTHEDRRDRARTLLLLPNVLHARLRQPRVLAACGIGLLLVGAAAVLALGERDSAGADTAGGPGGSAAHGQATLSPGGDTPCGGLLDHKAWRGTVSYRQERDARDSNGRHHTRYTFDLSLGGEMPRVNRNEHRGTISSTRYLSQSAAGRIEADYRRDDLDSSGGIRGYSTFTANGTVRAHEEGMAEQGTLLGLNLSARDCSYWFQLQPHALGSWTNVERSGRTTGGEGHMMLNSVSGRGIASSPDLISGSAPFLEVSSRMREALQTRGGNDSWVSERDDGIADEDLGTVIVTWRFEAVK